MSGASPATGRASRRAFDGPSASRYGPATVSYRLDRHRKPPAAGGGGGGRPHGAGSTKTPRAAGVTGITPGEGRLGVVTCRHTEFTDMRACMTNDHPLWFHQRHRVTDLPQNDNATPETCTRNRAQFIPQTPLRQTQNRYHKVSAVFPSRPCSTRPIMTLSVSPHP